MLAAKGIGPILATIAIHQCATKANALSYQSYSGRWGPELQDAFERECQNRGIKLFALPLLRSLKLNGHVERAQRTHTEEFYEVTDASFELPELNRALLKREKMYNTVRPIKP